MCITPTNNIDSLSAKGQIGYVEYPWEELDELDWFRGLKD